MPVSADLNAYSTEDDSSAYGPLPTPSSNFEDVEVTPWVPFIILSHF